MAQAALLLNVPLCKGGNTTPLESPSLVNPKGRVQLGAQGGWSVRCLQTLLLGNVVGWALCFLGMAGASNRGWQAEDTQLAQGSQNGHLQDLSSVWKTNS